MRIRIISATIVLGLGLVGIALAQQGKSDESPSIRAKLRSELAKLRAEVELMELEHAIDADLLKKAITDVKNLDLLASEKGRMKEALKEIMKGEPAAPASPVALPFLQGDAAVEDRVNTEDRVNEATAKLARPIVARLRKEFSQKATELNEKRLELAEIETRYNQAR